MSSRHLLNIKLMFILFSNVVNSVFISDELIISSRVFWPLLWALCASFSYYFNDSLKNKNQSQTKTNHKKITGTQFEAKYMCELSHALIIS